MEPVGRVPGFEILNSNLAAWEALVGCLSMKAAKCPPLLVLGPGGVGKREMIRAALQRFDPRCAGLPGEEEPGVGERGAEPGVGERGAEPGVGERGAEPREAAAVWLSADALARRLVRALGEGSGLEGCGSLLGEGRIFVVERLEELSGKSLTLEAISSCLEEVRAHGGRVIMTLTADRLDPGLWRACVPRLREPPVVLVVPPPLPGERRGLPGTVGLVSVSVSVSVDVGVGVGVGAGAGAGAGAGIRSGVEEPGGSRRPAAGLQVSDLVVDAWMPEEVVRQVELTARSLAAPPALRPLDRDQPPVLERPPGRLVVIGVGGRGVSFVRWHVATGDDPLIEHVACDCDRQLLDTVSGARRYLLEVAEEGRHPTALRRAAMNALYELLDELPEGAAVVLVAGLGGCAGSGAAPAIAEGLRLQEVDVRAVVTMPFDFEGAMRRGLAASAAQRIGGLGVPVYVHDNQELVDQRPYKMLPVGFREQDLEIARRLRKSESGPAPIPISEEFPDQAETE